jgi:hypothetical protein
MRLFSPVFLTYHEIYSIQRGINKGINEIPIMVNNYGLLKFTPLGIISLKNSVYKASTLGDCNLIFKMVPLKNEIFKYSYTNKGDLDVYLLKHTSNFNDVSIEYETCRTVYPIKTVKLPRPLIMGDILLSCPGL